ncbi:MAG: trypsin-like peptidase domain-containing protein, partial [Xanthomonadales bacterium]|nr:trypsin-like peptidase domain-containing protein [Xanthomonadales bacterium]
PALAERLADKDTPTEVQTATAPASYADAVNRTAPAVVSLQTRSIQPQIVGSRALFRMQVDDGSGVLMSEDGYILTNHHVIGNAQKARVALWDGRVELATVVGSDLETDLAVLKIDQTGLPTAPIPEDLSVRPGDIVLAIGNALGLSHTVTLGIVSATGRNDLRASLYEDYIQTDAAINTGNSGGALINTRGELIGISTRNTADAQNIGFAIPISLALNVMNQIIDYGTVRRGWLGALYSDIRPTIRGNSSPGIGVARVIEDGPAWNAGIRQGDIILALDGETVTDAGQFLLAISQREPGSEVELDVSRGSETFQTYATLIQQPPLQ